MNYDKRFSAFSATFTVCDARKPQIADCRRVSARDENQPLPTCSATPERLQKLKKKLLRCGLSWPHKDQPCPAEGQQCKNCKKYNHFVRVCWSTGRKQPNNENVTLNSKAMTVMNMCTHCKTLLTRMIFIRH